MNSLLTHRLWQPRKLQPVMAANTRQEAARKRVLFFQQLEHLEPQHMLQAQQMYNARIAECDQRVHERKRVLEAAHARFQTAMDAYYQPQVKRARTNDLPVQDVVEEKVIQVEVIQVVQDIIEVIQEGVIQEGVVQTEENAETKAVEESSESLVMSVIEAEEAVLVVVNVPDAQEQLKRADLAATEAIAYVYKLRRDIFLQQREARNSQLALNHRQLALNHEGRVRAECERVERGVIVPPVEYVLLTLSRDKESACYYRVLLGECNLTFSILHNSCHGERGGLTRKQWEDRYRKTAPLWNFWNRLIESEMPQIDPDFQDDVFILPHFREEIATHLESQSMIHTASPNTFFLCANTTETSKMDASFQVTLKFLARMKKFNRLEFATISCAL